VTRHTARTLPLRLWLALALVAVVGIPVFVTWTLSQQAAAWKREADRAPLAAVQSVLGHDVGRWRDPAWQRRAARTFSALGVEVGLVAKSGGRPGVVFATGNALRWMGAIGLVPLSPAQKAAKSAELAPSKPPWLPVGFRQIAILSPTSGAQRRVLAVATLWFTRSPTYPPSWLPQAGGLVALLLTLGLMAAALRHIVVRPLAAMDRAAGHIARGELEIDVPSSPAREVASVSAALMTMSAGLREAVRRQADLEQERRLFIGAIAHDLRTPIFTLSAYLAGLKDGLATTPEKAAQYVEACQEQTAALERLVADLFAYSRLEYLEQEPRREPLELGAGLRRVVERLEPRALAAGVALVAAGDATPCPISGDPQLLERVVENLLDNALLYTPAGGRVTLRWGQAADGFSFSVEDTGPGIAAHDLPHLFTPLYRGEPSRNRHTGGAGLGLAIARRIMRAHGGDLSADNGANGGALFTATLPAACPIPPDPGTVTAGAASD
jgi:signal transduction histidine kinase